MINQKHFPDPVISMEFLHSFLRCYLVGKPVVVSPLKCQLFSPAIQEVFVKVNSAQFNPSGFLSAKFLACPKKKCLLNPLRTNIHMQIILTDLHIFLRKLGERIR